MILSTVSVVKPCKVVDENGNLISGVEILINCAIIEKYGKIDLSKCKIIEVDEEVLDEHNMEIDEYVEFLLENE